MLNDMSPSLCLVMIEERCSGDTNTNKQQQVCSMCISAGWSTKDIPSQTGKLVIVTGANSGIGYYTALELARAGAKVILAVRDAKRGTEAMKQLQSLVPQGKFELMLVDMSNLNSVKAFAEAVNRRPEAVDILINNAGIMMLPQRELSPDGYEMQFATNHLGHFALTVRLLPSLLRSSRKPRVVTVASVVAWFAAAFPTTASQVDFRRDGTAYHPKKVYAASKLANLMFMRELSKRFPMITSVAAHPGGSATNLHQHAFGNLMWLMQSSQDGALPTLRAAVDEKHIESGSYVGPRVLMMKGAPSKVMIPPQATRADECRALWEASEKATGVGVVNNNSDSNGGLRAKL